MIRNPKILAVHKALGHDWLYSKYNGGSPIFKVSRIPGSSYNRICPICGLLEGKNSKGQWRKPHEKRSSYYFHIYAAARLFIQEEEKKIGGQV